MNKLKSRKLAAAVAAAIINFFGEQLGLTPDAITQLTAIAGAYIIGQGIADAGAGKSQTSK